MEQLPIPKNNTRIGMHYFPDAEHYQESDLDTWLPKLTSLKANWVTLQALSTRAIPEYFVRGLVNAGINPVLQFDLDPDNSPEIEDLQAMLSAYANWGVHYVSLFDRPNIKAKWSSQSWASHGLVKRFMNGFIPLANHLVQAGLKPIFPGLEPGGDYWDTAFLRSALQLILESGNSELFDSLVLGCYAWGGDASLNWGAGGPERWAGAQPYNTPEEEQDQLGFRIFDWYTTVSKAVLGSNLPILILAGGSTPGIGVQQNYLAEDVIDHAAQNLQIAKLMAGETEATSSVEILESVPDHVLSCNFWLLADERDGVINPASWFKPDGSANASAVALLDWNRKPTPTSNQQVENIKYEQKGAPSAASGHSIHHYLLLPVYEWGVADWHLDVIRPYIKKHTPTIGFSVSEAAKAEKVTIVGAERSFSSENIRQLRENGCEIEQINGDGTSIATQLENL